MEENRPLLFLHIRKTAGRSVRDWLFQRFPAQSCLLDAHHVQNQDRDPSAYQFVTGHVGFAYIQRFARQPIRFTVLRHPLDRALSAYFFFRGHTDPFLQWLKGTLPAKQGDERVRFTKRANELSLLEFLQQEPELAHEWLGNVQTRSLLAARPDQYSANAEMLDKAKQNLESCECVGLTERLGDSLGLLAHQLGWDPDLGSVPHENPTHGRPSVKDIDPPARDILTDWNQLDLELYQFAERLFFRRLQALQWPAGQTGKHLPDCVYFTFDQPIHGQGWYLRERGSHGWFCWMGAEREAWIDLKLEGKGERWLQAGVVHVLRPSVLDSLQIRVNGQPLEVYQRPQGSGYVIEGLVPAAVAEAARDRVRISFRVNETVRPRDLIPESLDERVLGVALGHIRLMPVARPLPRWRALWRRSA